MPVLTEVDANKRRRRGSWWLLLLLIPATALLGVLAVPFFHPVGFQVGMTHISATTYGVPSLSLPQWHAADVPPISNDGPLLIEGPVRYRSVVAFGKVYKVVWFRASRRR